MVAFEALVERLEPLTHLQRGAESPFRIVLEDGGHAEDRHDRVPDVLLDGAAPRGDDARHLGEVRTEQRPQAFGIQLLPEAGRAGYVREQNRDDLALLSAVPRIAELGSAARAKPRAIGYRRAAGRAGYGHERSLGRPRSPDAYSWSTKVMSICARCSLPE